MKKILKALGSDDRHLFRAKVLKYSERPRWSKFEKTIVLDNVKLWPANERVAHNLWFFLGKTFLQAGLQPGDWIEFEARAKVRRTGYRGPDQRLRRAYRGRTKWTLTHPSKVRKVNPKKMISPVDAANELTEPERVQDCTNLTGPIMKPAFIKLTEDEFDAQHSLIPNPFNSDAAWEGCLFDTVGDEYAFVAQQNLNCIWTLLEDGDGNSFISSGLHFVNRLGYLVSEKPVPDGQVIEVHWDNEYDVEEDEDDSEDE